MKTLLIICLAAFSLGAADKKKQITNEAGNENLDITANPIIDADGIKTALGAELPTGIIVIEVKMAPKGDEKVSISRDDFILISHKDGQRSGPYGPSQIAGSTTMVVKTQGINGGGLARQRSGPVWGGMGGGRPRQVDDGSGGGMGNTASNETKTTAEIKDDPNAQDNPLLKVLKSKMLPEKETNDAVSGLLYFPLDGKVKTKDLELIYQGPAGRMYINFR